MQCKSDAAGGNPPLIFENPPLILWLLPQFRKCSSNFGAERTKIPSQKTSPRANADNESNTILIY